jgi:hypothetical protein
MKTSTKNARKASTKKAATKQAQVAAPASTARKAAAATKAAPVVQQFSGLGYVGRIEGTKLTITMDLAITAGPSDSGKSEVIAKSDRFVELPGQDVTTWLNLMVCRKAVK